MAQELEGEWVMGWPDRKRARIMPSKDAEGRTIYARSPVLDLEGMLTPTDAYYIIAQLNMPDPVHPDDFSFSIDGMVDSPTQYTLEEIRKLPGRTVRAVTECAGNDGEFFDYIKPGSNMKKPSLRVVQAEEGGWRQAMDSDETPDIEDIRQSIPSTGLVSGGEWTGVQLRSVLERAAIQEGAVLRGAARLGRRKARPGDPVSLRRAHRLRGGRSRHHQLRQGIAAGEGPAQGHDSRLGPQRRVPDPRPWRPAAPGGGRGGPATGG